MALVLEVPADLQWQATSNAHVSKSVVSAGSADSAVVPERSSVVVAVEVFDIGGTALLFTSDAPLCWRLGDRTIPRALDTAVSTMRAEETALFLIRKHSAHYGAGATELTRVFGAADVIARIALHSFTFSCKVVDDGGVTKTVVTFGASDGGHPNDSSVCEVTVDDHRRVTWTVGETTDFLGLDDALKSMSAGETSDFQLTPTYAERAEPLRLRLQLHHFVRGAETWQMSDDAKFAFMARWKALGNDSFAAGNVRRALRRYNKVLTTLQSDAHLSETMRVGVRTLKSVTHVNVALCFFRQRDYKESVSHCSHSLQLAPSVKAYVRRAIAYEAMGDDECARSDLEAAKQLEPKNGAVIQELQKLAQKRALYESELKKRFGGWISAS